MHGDAFFAIGKSHAVCQDYAVAGLTVAGRPCVALADGCSTSEHSDIGARVLASLAALRLRHSATKLELPALCRQAQPLTGKLGLGSRGLDSTLLYAWADESHVRVEVVGDGIVAVRRPSGRVEAWEVEFAHQAPAYPSYLLDEGRMASYRALGSQRHVIHWQDGERRDEREASLKSLEQYSLSFDFPLPEVELVLVLSDGARSFYQQQRTATGVCGQPVPLPAVLQQLTAVCSYRGQFMVRRGRRFTNRFCREHRWHHDDDLAVGAIWCGDRP